VLPGQAAAWFGLRMDGVVGWWPLGYTAPTRRFTMAALGDYETEIRLSTGEAVYVREPPAQTHAAMNKALTGNEVRVVSLTRDDGVPIAVALDHIVFYVPRAQGGRDYKPGSYRKREITD
jgi:hypothetical protein